MTIQPPSDAALQTVWAALPQARLVGGCVRDLLVGYAPTDFDLAAPLQPEQIMQALRAAGLKSVPTGLAHGTVTAVCQGTGFEITTLRRDEDTDGRHARVVWTTDWHEDAARRDFTINAMSLTREGTLWDYFDGAADLKAGRVRFVGKAATRITEDYLRILRFFRFYARYGHGLPDTEAMEAIRHHRDGLASLSRERIWSELQRILALPDPVTVLGLMRQTGVLDVLLPDGFDVERCSALIRGKAPVDAMLRLAALARGEPRDLARSLRMSAQQATRLTQLTQGPVPASQMPDLVLQGLLENNSPRMLADRVWLNATLNATGLDATGDAQAQDVLRLQARLMALPIPRFPLEGRDVVALGVPAGPSVGQWLRHIQAWWRHGGYTATAQECRAELVRRLHKDLSQGLRGEAKR